MLVEEALTLVRRTPVRHDSTATRDDTREALHRQRDELPAQASMDGEVVDTLLSLLDERVTVELPGELVRLSLDLFQSLV